MINGQWIFPSRQCNISKNNFKIGSSKFIIYKKVDCCKKNIIKGEKFSKKNLTCKRPGNGISPDKVNELVGKVAQVDIKEDFQINKTKGWVLLEE